MVARREAPTPQDETLRLKTAAIHKQAVSGPLDRLSCRDNYFNQIGATTGHSLSGDLPVKQTEPQLKCELQLTAPAQIKFKAISR